MFMYVLILNFENMWKLDSRFHFMGIQNIGLTERKIDYGPLVDSINFLSKKSKHIILSFDWFKSNQDKKWQHILKDDIINTNQQVFIEFPRWDFQKHIYNAFPRVFKKLRFHNISETETERSFNAV